MKKTVGTCSKVATTAHNFHEKLKTVEYHHQNIGQVVQVAHLYLQRQGRLLYGSANYKQIHLASPQLVPDFCPCKSVD